MTKPRTEMKFKETKDLKDMSKDELEWEIGEAGARGDIARLTEIRDLAAKHIANEKFIKVRAAQAARWSRTTCKEQGHQWSHFYKGKYCNVCDIDG
ncbi:MAG: hypothetical protein OSB10_04375 [Planctomycetota bacterium]|nr:hypothetical protein [Planctomycetota bacterium]